jgi:hypothetical protein
MFNKAVFPMIALATLAGCASVPMASSEKSAQAMTFPSPSEGNAGVYVYRSGVIGGALKKDIWIDGKCIGESAPNVFFHEEVKGDSDHKLSTESEFSPNDLVVKMMAGKNYFIRQYIKLGVFVGGAGLELVDEEAGKAATSTLKMAESGKCSK